MSSGSTKLIIYLYDLKGYQKEDSLYQIFFTPQASEVLLLV